MRSDFIFLFNQTVVKLREGLKISIGASKENATLRSWPNLVNFNFFQTKFQHKSFILKKYLFERYTT